MKRFPLLLVLALVFFAACSEQPSGPASDSEKALGKAASVDLTDETIDLKDRYIVVFKESAGNVDELVDQMTRGNGSTVHYRYRHALKGFAATIPPQAVEGLRRNPNVAYIEPDGMMYAITTQSPVPSWGLDRIDQRALPVDNAYNYANDASGIKVYIIDTGIRYDHVQFNGRAVFGYDAFGGTGADGNGHGTHVAGTVGGSTVGVAKAVTLVAVRVLNDRGSGTTSGVIAGVDYVRNNNTTYAVANMSLGGGFSSSLNAAVQNAINDNVTFAVAAGNESTDASTKSPASVGDAITVGATTGSDGWATYSNYGSVVDILAPGSSIYSAWKNSSTSYNTISGTSMATPHVAGVAALYLAANPNSTPLTIRGALVNAATTGAISGVPGSTANRLLYSGFITGGPTPTAPAAPTGLSATAVSYNQINLTWTDNATNESNYYVEISTNGGSTFTLLATLSSNATSYSSTGLTASTPYHYRVQAGNAVGYSAYSNTANATTLAQQLLTTVHVTSVSTSSSWINSVNWSATMSVTVTAGSSPVSGATVSFTWTGGSGTAVTGTNGVATITTGGINSKKVSSISMNVAGVTGTNLTYGGANPSTLLPVTVNKP